MHYGGVGAGLLQAGKVLKGRRLQKTGRFQSRLIRLLVRRKEIYKRIPVHPPYTAP